MMTKSDLADARTLGQLLGDGWVDLDLAAFFLAQCLGLIPGSSKPTAKTKWIFWSANPIGDALYAFLERLVSLGALEKNEDEQVRWNARFSLEHPHREAKSF